MKKIKLKKYLFEYVNMTLGIALVGLTFSFFLNPYNLVIGGVGGVAIILKEYMDTALIVLIIDVILLLLGLIFMGKEYFIKNVYGSLMLPLFIYIFELVYKWLQNLNDGNLLISEDNMLLITVFGALLTGVGIGYAIKFGGSTGGTEILQNIVYKYFHIPFSASLYFLDGTVVLLGFLFIRDANGMLKYDFLLYAIIFIYLSGIVMDQIIFRGFKKRAVYIISEKSDEIKEKILNELERGVTEMSVIGGYTGEERKTLLCVLSSSQFYHLKSLINSIDPKAFYYVVRANEVGGEGFTYDEYNRY